MKRRNVLGCALAGAWAMSHMSSADASQVTTMVVGYGAGGNVDVFARSLGKEVARLIKQPVVVDNKPGANEMIAAQAVMRSPEQNNTILISTEAPITQSQFLYKKLAYVPEDLTPIALLIQVPMVLVVRPDMPANSIAEFVEYGKKNGIIGGSAGIGGVTHLPMAMLAKSQNFPWTHAPYKGSSAMFPDLIAGRIDACFTGSSAAITQIQAKRIKGLAVGSKVRLPALPQLETFEENGISNIGSTYSIGAYGPKGMSPAAREQLAAAFEAVLKDPEFVRNAVTPNGFLVDGRRGREFEDYLKADRIAQQERVKVSGAQLD